ncbi:hypothetical protein PF002_g8616 [Phytophthora fragariae]|uniref:Uncharacterized protein n=1 Tax=Phytophthora fragariae TaxID=53985 RepID=A0A6A3ZWJ0_9STRA|nr:hypothetical protein PF002_g8616 [Phytophthora fragariae]
MDATERPGKAADDGGAEEGQERLLEKSGPGVNDDAKEKETELRSGTSRTVTSTVAKRLVWPVRFEDQPTVLGMDEALRHMITDTAGRDDRRASIYVATVRPALAAMKYASEAQEVGLCERIGKSVRERQVGVVGVVGRAGDGAMAPSADVDGDGVSKSTAMNPMDDEERRMTTPTAEMAGRGCEVTVSPTREGDTNRGVLEAGSETGMAVCGQIRNKNMLGKVGTPVVGTELLTAVVSDGVDAHAAEPATVRGDDLMNGDAAVITKQDEISQARLARHKIRKAAKRRCFRAPQLRRRREAEATEDGRQEAEEAQ